MNMQEKNRDLANGHHNSLKQHLTARRAISKPPISDSIPETVLYEQILSNDDFVDRLCFTTCVDNDNVPAAVGLIRSIRKFYAAREAAIVLFIDKPSATFAEFCAREDVELHRNREIQGWVLDLVYADPIYINDTRHYYHPNFQPVAGLAPDPRRNPGFGQIRHLGLLNVKAYCTGYSLCMKNYRRVMYIDAKAFLLGRIDEVVQRHRLPGTVVAFGNENVELERLDTLYGVPWQEHAEQDQFGFRGDLVYYVNSREVKQLARDFMFFIESCCHFKHSSGADGCGVLRSVIAKHKLLGKVQYYRETEENWLSASLCDLVLTYDPAQNAWFNGANGRQQIIVSAAGSASLSTGRNGSPSVNKAWQWIGGPLSNDWSKEYRTETRKDNRPFYERVLSDNNFVDKICFTACLNARYKLGAMGLIRSIRKFYTPEEADIIVFVDEDFEDFPQFCGEHYVELCYFADINDWVQPLVYEDPLYANDNSHYYHPDFQPAPGIPYSRPTSPGFGLIHHLHPLNIKAYATGYCLCVRNYKRVVHIDCDAFLLAKIDEMFDKHNELNTVIGFEDDNDELPNLEPIFSIKKPACFNGAQYGFNAGIVFYINGAGTKKMVRDFMFFMESCYHWDKAGSYDDWDQGLLRCIVAKNGILGNIRFRREDNWNWNPTWRRADVLDYSAETDTWTNRNNGLKQYIWHSPVHGGYLQRRLWTGREPSPTVNDAWRWVGGQYEDWRSIPGSPSELSINGFAERLSAVFEPCDGRRCLNVLEIGSRSCRAAIGLWSLLSERGFDVRIDACEFFAECAAEGVTEEIARDNIVRLGADQNVICHNILVTESLRTKFGDRRFDVVCIHEPRSYHQLLADCFTAVALAGEAAVITGSPWSLAWVRRAVTELFAPEFVEAVEDRWLVRLADGLSANESECVVAAATGPLMNRLGDLEGILVRGTK